MFERLDAPTRWVALAVATIAVVGGTVVYGKVQPKRGKAPVKARPIVQLPTAVRNDFTAFVERLLKDPPRDPAGFFLTIEQELTRGHGRNARSVRFQEEPEPWGCNQDPRDRKPVSREQSFTYEDEGQSWAYLITANWNFDDRDDGRIRGTVRDQAGKPKSGARVTASGAYRKHERATTADRRGRFTLKVPSDFYAVTANAKDCTVATRERVDACAYGTIASGRLRRARAPGESITLTLRCGEEFTVDQLSKRPAVPGNASGLGVTTEGAGTFAFKGSRSSPPATGGPGWVGRWEVRLNLAVAYTADIPSQNLTRFPLRLTSCTAPTYRTDHRIRRRGTMTFELPPDLQSGGVVAVRYAPEGPAEVAERELTAGVRCCNPEEPEVCDPVRNEFLTAEGSTPQQAEEWRATATVAADGVTLALPSPLFLHGNYELSGDPIALRIRPKGGAGGALPPAARPSPSGAATPSTSSSTAPSDTGRRASSRAPEGGIPAVELPSDFPRDIPVRSGGELTGAGSTWASWLFTGVTPVALGDFYDAELPKRGWTITGGGVGPPGGIIVAMKGKRDLQVNIGSDQFGLGKTQVTVRQTSR